MTKLNPSYKSSVDVAILNGKSHLSLHNFKNQKDFNIKKLQKAIRQYAKRMNSEVSTQHDKFYDELVILRKEPAKNYQLGIVANVIGVKVPTTQDSFEKLALATPSATETNEWKHPIQVPYEFKVGDAGITACGENYVVLEKKKDGRLLVSVKSLGSWNIGLRNSDGTCIYNYTNKQRFALIPPKQPKKQIRTVYLNVYEDNTDVFCHATEADAKLHANDNARAVAIPVTFEFTPLR